MTMNAPALPLGAAPRFRFAIPREGGMFGALVVLCLILWITNDKFFSQSNIFNTSSQISMLGIYTIGMAFVIVTGGIDLSVGSIVGLTGILIAQFSSSEPGCFGWSLWIGIPLALLLVSLIGLAQGLLITCLGLQPFIVTLGSMLTIRGVSQVMVNGASISLAGSPIIQLSNKGVLDFGSGPYVPYTLIIFLVVIVLGTYLLHFTVFGRYVFAIGGNRDAAVYSGIPVKQVETATYVISAFLAGIGGVCYAAYVSQMSHQVGIAYELFAVSAAVLGGASLRGGEGTILGVVIGSAILKVIDNGIVMFQFPYLDRNGINQLWRLNTNWNFVIFGGVILVAIILDQVFHIFKANRRSRQVAESSSRPAAPGFEVLQTPAEKS